MRREKEIEKFYQYLDELDQSYERLHDLLRQKLIALDQYNVPRLEEILKEEQAYVLLSRGFEPNIQGYRERLELRGETLADVIGELPDDVQGRFQIQHTRLKSRLDSVKALNDKCQQVLETRLHTLNKAIKQIDHSENETYKKGGDPTSGDAGPRLFTKSV